MKLLKLVLITGLALSLSACNNNNQKTARGNEGDVDEPDRKPDPVPTNFVEDFAVLKLQKLTLDDSEFLNIMNLPVENHEQALFSFKYAANEDGTMFFTKDQVRVLPKECAKPAERNSKFTIYWQRVQGKERVVEKVFTPDFEYFEFKKGNNYILTYALPKLQDFADCKSVTLKFAMNPKRFNKDSE